METLPLEVVEIISSYLTSQDLEQCVAVSHSWRDTFNQDILWKPHCNTELQEYINNTPCTFESCFAILEDEELPLSPICPRRLAFMREKFLRTNWKGGFYKKATHLPGAKLLRRVSDCEFITDNILLTHCVNAIEIWDLGPNPAILLMKTDRSIHINRWLYCMVLGTYTLVLKQPSSVQVFHLDLQSKSIFLEQEIQLDESYGSFVAKLVDESSYIGLASNSSANKLIIYDLKKGEKIKEEPCPIDDVRTIDVKRQLETAAKCEDVLVLYENNMNSNATAFVYDTKNLCFHPGIRIFYPFDECRLNHHYLAYLSRSGPVIFDYETTQKVFSYRAKRVVALEPFHDMFLFLEYANEKSLLHCFSLKNKTFSTIFEKEFLHSPTVSRPYLSLVNNKFVALLGGIDLIVFEHSHKSLRQVCVNIPLFEGVFNKFLARSYSHDVFGYLVITYYW